MRGKVLVTPRSITREGHPALDRLRQAGLEVITCTPDKQPTEEQLLSLLPGCVAMLAGVERISARVLEAAAAKGLKVIARNGIGTDNVDLAAARRLGVRVERAADANSRGVAELTMAAMLAMARSLVFHDGRLKAGKWDRLKGFELEGKTLGLIGCGQVGKLVAKLSLGMGMKVLAYDPAADATFAPGPGFAFASMDRLVGESDVISLHCPPSPDGRPLVDAAFLAAAKDGAMLINTARASLLDEPAVLAALDSGRLAGLATDVFAAEPPPPGPLLEHPRVLATPHVGGYTTESVDRAVSAAVDAILACLK